MNRRQFKFNYLVSACVLSAIALSAELSSALQQQSERSIALKEAGLQIARSLDKSVNPCSDFYQFACGNWKSTQNISKSGGYDIFDILNEAIANNLKLILEEPENESTETLFYRKCLDREQINKLAHQPLAQVLLEASGHRWPIVYPSTVHLKHFDWQFFHANLFLLNVNPLFSITFDPKSEDNHRSQITIKPPKSKHNILLEYKEMFAVAAHFASAQPGPQLINPIILHQRIIEMIYFEEALRSIESPNAAIVELPLGALKSRTRLQFNWKHFLNNIFRQSMRQLNLLVNKVADAQTDGQLIGKSMEILKLAFTLAQNQSVPPSNMNYARLSKLAKLLDHSQLQLIKHWISEENVISQLVFSFFNSPMFSENDRIAVDDVDYFGRLIELLHSTPKHVLLNYMGWMTISRYRDYLGGSVGEVLNQDDSPPPQWRSCIKQLLKVYPWKASHQYVKRFVGTDVKARAAHLVRQAKLVFERVIQSAKWLDPLTKKLALEKLRSMKPSIAYPDWLLNEYSAFNDLAKTNSYDKQKWLFEMAIQKLTFDRAWRLVVLKLTSLNDFHGWFEAPIVVTAYNDLMSNSIGIPFSILQPPFFHRHYPPALNYGGIVITISHELMHGFDPTGIHYDQVGNLVEWWHPLAWGQYHSKAMCFAWQYNQLFEPILPRFWMSVNGFRTNDENTADNGAIRVAYAAFKSQALTPMRIPYLEQFSAEQIFFLQYAQTFCTNISPDQMLMLLQDGIHSPDKYRVNVPLSNLRAFARAFRCPPSSPMNSRRKCAVW